MNRFRFWPVLLVALLVLGPLASAVPVRAADPVTITFALPDYWAELWGGSLIDEFEAEHPDIRVKIVQSDAGYAWHPGGSGDIADYLDQVAEYASAADVLYVNSSSLTETATQAGYFLDLAPLTSADAGLNEEDFYPAAWQSFQWDSGVWALPVSLDVVMVVYRPAAFDEVGLSYPSAAWTITDLVNAVRTLTQFDAEGNIVRPALAPDASTLTALFRSLLGRGLYDPATTPNAPLLTGADVESILNEWAQLQQDGYLTMPDDVDYDAIPLRIESATYSLAGDDVPNPDVDSLAVALLPGGLSSLQIEAVALSAGTQHPDQAYEFIKYVSHSPRAATAFYSARPARRSLIGVASPDDSYYGASPQFTPEKAALIDDAIAHALPISELRYCEYLGSISDKITLEQMDVAGALQTVELKAQEDYQAALARRGTPVVVAAPPPDVVLAPGEIDLKFGLAYMVSPLPNQDQWDRLVEEFVAGDPAVGHLQLDTAMFDASLGSMAQEYDCFYLPYNAVPGGDMAPLLSLDPFLDADPDFDRTDVYPGVLAQLQQASLTWAYPLVIQPRVLRYNTALFDQAGVPWPEQGWTVSQFTDALAALQSTLGTPPFVTQNYDGTPYLLLIAAFGGLPFDYRTTPPAAQFTAPATVEAIRQVLDLARGGSLQYQPLALTSSMSGSSGGFDITTPIFDFNLSNLFYAPSDGEQDPYRTVTYPTGTSYAPVSYDIGAAYISATAQNPAACYAWIGQLAQHPNLVTGLPARRSQLSDPRVAAVLDPEMLNLAQQLDQTLSRPDLVVVPSSMGSGGDLRTLALRFLSENWLYRAFDNYVKNGTGLEDELAQAQQFVQDFQGCVADIPPQDPGTDEQTYVMQFLNCATAVDPSLSSVLQ